MSKRSSTQQIKAELTFRKYEQKSEIVKGAIAYTMPAKPQQAFLMMQEQKGRNKQNNDLQISKQIMFIPFPQIRNCIIAFMRPFKQEYSQTTNKDEYITAILATELQSNSKLKLLNQNLSNEIYKAYHTRIKLESLQNCLDKAKILKDTVFKLKTKIKDKLSVVDLDHKLKDIQRQLPEYYEETQKNKKIIELFRSNAKIYKQINKHYIDLNFAYKQIKEYTKDIQKIIPIVSRYQGVIIDEMSSSQKGAFTEHLQKEITSNIKNIKQLLHQAETRLQLFRDMIKREPRRLNSNISDLAQFKKQQTIIISMIQKLCKIDFQIKQEVYSRLSILNQLEKDIIKDPYGQKRDFQEYANFVKTYTDIKQIDHCGSSLNDFLRIIELQEKNLSSHLKLNCSLIVYYKQSKQFEKFNQSLMLRKYIAQLFMERIQPINQAIKFINEQHGEMYKRACQNGYGRLRRQNVKDKMNQFEKNFAFLSQKYKRPDKEDQHFQYFNHLIISLGRLMTLCKD